MPEWSDQGIVLSAKKYGEKGVVINILTENHGRYLGWFTNYKNKRTLVDVEPGNLVKVFWKSRLVEQMGQFKIELISSVSGKIFDEKLKLQALNSVCSLLVKFLPERQNYFEIFNATFAFINLLTLQEEIKNDYWIKGYVKWEIGILSSIGFSLDLNRCAVTGKQSELHFVSPKTGKAVSKEGAGNYAPKLLVLPSFLGGVKVKNLSFYNEILAGLNITSYFFRNKLLLSVNSNKSINLPNSRIRLVEMIEKL